MRKTIKPLFLTVAVLTTSCHAADVPTFVGGVAQPPSCTQALPHGQSICSSGGER